MEKAVIKPDVMRYHIDKKLDQKKLDKHVRKNLHDNQGCPLIPIHKMDPIYHQQMQDVLNSKSARPKEQSW